MPGGVNSPVRAFKSMGGNPVFLERALGSFVYDADGNEYIDYVLSWGPLILGHACPEVVESLKGAVGRGTSFGAPTELEVLMARTIAEALPSVQQVRMVNSGTEANMSALRLARGYTGRNKVLKFEGCYHGHADSFLVKAGSGVATLGLPDSPGVPGSVASDTLIAPYNDIDAVNQVFARFGEEIAAVVVEPVAGNMGVIPPVKGFLEVLRSVTTWHGSLLIFDEVITGFRVAYGGAQALYGVVPDLTCLGKIVGGGLPVGAYGGRADIMQHVAPSGLVYQAGTLSGNPLAMTAGLVTLMRLQLPGVYQRLEENSRALEEGLEKAAERMGLPLRVNRVGSMLTPFFTEGEVRNMGDAMASDARRYRRFFWGMLDRGVWLPPSPYEAMFLSLAHDHNCIERTVQAVTECLGEIRRGDLGIP
jgi:glutamate-1-semialdehyde 2,1-aminomutase